MFQKTFDLLAQSQASGLALEVRYRKQQLVLLIQYLRDHKEGLVQAIHRDYVLEAGAEMEVMQMMACAEKTLSSVDYWARGKRVSTGWSLMQALDTASIHYDPLGVVLVIGTWNVPLLSVVEPMIGAIAAGCCVVIKPSEISSNTAEYLSKTLGAYLDPRTVAVFTGGADDAAHLIETYRWDSIFFTGGQRVGRLVYAQAAAKLIPCVLELGGKSPVLVLEGCGKGLQLAADRIVWGKVLKAGQICIAPDYLLVEDAVFDKFLGCLINSLSRLYGQAKSRDIDYIVSGAHWDRLAGLLSSCGGRVLFEGVRTRADRYFGPVLVSEPSLDSPLMTDEIFGPILPVVRVKDYREAIAFVNARPKPLILYAFTNNRASLESIKTLTRSGNFCANDVVLSFTVDGLPFGGVGASGLGAYHGRKTFEAFSHAKACLERRLQLGWLDNALRFPPFTKARIRRLQWVMLRAPDVIRRACTIGGLVVLAALLIAAWAYAI